MDEITKEKDVTTLRINLFEVLPPGVIDDLLKSREFNNLDYFYDFTYESRISILSLLKSNIIEELPLFGRVYTFGIGRYGELGDGIGFVHTRLTPYMIENLPRILDVGVGNYFSILLSEHGRIYSFGSGILGKLGDNNVKNHTVSRPQLIDPKLFTDIIGNPEKIIAISVSTLHVLVLTVNFGN